MCVYTSILTQCSYTFSLLLLLHTTFLYPVCSDLYHYLPGVIFLSLLFRDSDKCHRFNNSNSRNPLAFAKAS